MTFYKNPFSKSDPDRSQLWKMLVERDIIAFCAQDWKMVEDDFIPEKAIYEATTLRDIDIQEKGAILHKTYFRPPLPVRTAVQTPLLMTLLAEIEMWAVQK